MKTAYSEKISRILKGKNALEKELNVKITINGKEISIQGETVDEYIAEKVITALNFGFPFRTAMLIKEEEDYEFEIISIKDFTRSKDLRRVRARIIGSGGKTLKTMSQLTKCHFELKDNEVGIIGEAVNIKNAQNSMISLIKGTKQANVYSYLEKHQPEEIIDLGLKPIKKKKKE